MQEWTESPSDEQFDKALDRYVCYTTLSEITRLGIHLKHLQAKQKILGPKSLSLWPVFAPLPAHLVFHKIVFHLPTLTPNLVHTDLRGCSWDCERLT